MLLLEEFLNLLEWIIKDASIKIKIKYLYIYYFFFYQPFLILILKIIKYKFVIKEILVSRIIIKINLIFSNKNIFKIDKIKILNNLQNYLVKKIEINKIYPDKLNIKLIETLPIANL